MNEAKTVSYDGLGWLYDRHWRGLWPKALRALDAIALRGLRRGARILDIGCGAGHLAAALVSRGYQVTGVDPSEDMLRYARANAPGATFIRADARELDLPAGFDAAVSTFDAMNHLLTPEDLARACANVYRALRPGGLFVFDLNMATAFSAHWRESAFVVAEDHLYIVRGGYDRRTKLGRTELTLMRREGAWTRRDVVLYERCYSRADVRGALARAGFASSEVFTARGRLKMRGRMAVGRAYFRAVKTG